MASSLVTRSAIRGGYGALMRSRTGSVPRVTARAFSAAPQFREKLYAKSHEWLEYSADEKTATIGVSEYAASSLGDVVYVELPGEGLDVQASDTFGCIESVKSASDLYSPVAGKIVETNQVLENEPGLINKDPEGKAWLAKIELTGEKPESLMSATEYKKFTEEQADAE